jgi:hypothetical protein
VGVGDLLGLGVGVGVGVVAGGLDGAVLLGLALAEGLAGVTVLLADADAVAPADGVAVASPTADTESS